MYISTIKLENAALKDFHRDANDKAEHERKEWWNDTMPFEVYPMNKVNEADIEMMEGGRGEFEMGEFGAETHGFGKKKG